MERLGDELCESITPWIAIRVDHMRPDVADAAAAGPLRVQPPCQRSSRVQGELVQKPGLKLKHLPDSALMDEPLRKRHVRPQPVHKRHRVDATDRTNRFIHLPRRSRVVGEWLFAVDMLAVPSRVDGNLQNTGGKFKVEINLGLIYYRNTFQDFSKAAYRPAIQ